LPIHIIDDEAVITEVLSAILCEHSEHILTFESAEAYLEYINSNQYHEPKLIITDVLMDGMSGFELIQIIRAKDPTVRIIVMSGFYDYNKGLPDNLNIHGTLSKPFDMKEIQSMVSDVLAQS